jgi:hypothetical protein
MGLSETTSMRLVSRSSVRAVVVRASVVVQSHAAGSETCEIVGHMDLSMITSYPTIQ